MAYFIEPLIKILDQILHPDQRQSWILDPNSIPQIESLLETSSFLRDALENSAAASEERIDRLEDKIRDVVQSAEDIIESRIADHVSSSRWGQVLTISSTNLQKVIEEFDSAKEEMMKILDGVQILQIESYAVPPRSDPNPKKIFVGFSEDLSQLKDRVTDWSPKLEIIPIVGMGGIGKTTLARNIYDDPSIVSYFDVRAWITISQDYKVRGVLLGLLGCVMGKHTTEMLEKRDNQLGVTLHQELMSRRYLITLDDIWQSKAWDDVKKFFPNENNGSRIILTTRESNVATYMDPKSSHHQMHLLNESDSWELLGTKVHGEETCPPELEKLERRITNGCRGLPLAIHVIGGLLSHAKRTKEFWEQVANDVSSTVANQDEQFSKILSLSYNHLPHYLKPCFLYMSAFPEDYEIRASKLIGLWVAEGFLRPIENKSLEEAAEAYLKALVDRNLIFVRKQGTNGKVKTYGIHDLLRDQSVSKARHKKFLYPKNRQIYDIPEGTICQRRVSFHTTYRMRDTYDSTGSMSSARSFLCTGPASPVILSPIFLALRLLRVLDVLEIKFLHFPVEIQELVNLRYLALSCGFSNADLSKLENLMTLIVVLRTYTDFVHFYKINMPQLRCIKFMGKLSTCFHETREFVFRNNLHTLSASALRISDFQKLFENAPNLKKLCISCEKNSDPDLAILSKLETLKVYSDSSSFTFLSFPSSLKKLTLRVCRVPQTLLNTIGKLPNLETLKLQNCTFENTNWEPLEGEFDRLQVLVLEKVNLKKWTADQSSFPRLRHLILRRCRAIKEISTDLGEIATLEIIEVDDSSRNVARIAKKILEEQRENGNDLLQVRITGSSR